MTTCDDCGKEFKDGDEAIGKTTGQIRINGLDDDGFFADENDWLCVLCIECNRRIDRLR